MKKKITISYISGYKKADEAGILSEEIFKSVKIDKMYTKLYSSGMIKLSMLKGIPFPLFMFLCQSCKNDGVVHSGEVYCEEFLIWFEKAAGVKSNYSLETIGKGYAQLTKAELLIKLGLGRYRINPVHFWKGSIERERVDAVRKLLEDKTIEPWITDSDKKKRPKRARSKKVDIAKGLDFDDFEV